MCSSTLIVNVLIHVLNVLLLVRDVPLQNLVGRVKFVKGDYIKIVPAPIDVKAVIIIIKISLKKLAILDIVFAKIVLILTGVKIVRIIIKTKELTLNAENVVGTYAENVNVLVIDRMPH